MAIVKGKSTIHYGPDVLAGVEDVTVNYDVATSDRETVQGRRYQISGAHLVTVEATFLESDVDSLAVVLPQYFVPNGGTLSTGEVVNNAAGAIDIVPDLCGDDTQVEDLVITSCNGHVMRVPDASSEISGVAIADGVRTVTVTFRGESDDATIQLFAQGAVNIVS